MEAYCLQALTTGVIDAPISHFVLAENQIIVRESHTYVVSDKYTLVTCDEPQRFARINNSADIMAFIGSEK